MKRWIKSVTKRAKAALSRRSSEATTNKKKKKKGYCQYYELQENIEIKIIIKR